jgi:hypothetical protein
LFWCGEVVGWWVGGLVVDGLTGDAIGMQPLSLV